MRSGIFRNRFGLVVLGFVLLASFGAVVSRNVQEVTSDRIEIRIGHAELHTGMREAFQAAIEAYELRHPEVRIVQVAVPPRVYPAWARTQLVGGTAPDIMPLPASDVEITQFFVSLTEVATASNRYNEGTSLEGIAWKDTFFDGLTGVSDRMAWTAPKEIFGVMLQTTSMRLYINRALLREITGSEDVSLNDYAALYALGEEVRRYNARTGQHIIPIASGKLYAEYIFNRIVGSQMQKFVVEYAFHMKPWGFFRPLYDGEYTYSGTPAFVSSLELMSEVSQLLTPGFQQFSPEDAIAAYLQQRSLMLVAGSWDYAVLVDRVPFETVVMRLPVPSSQDPKYGQFSLGETSETGSTTAALGVVRTSPNKDVAIDFLKFLTSQPVAAQFSDISKRISAIVDVPTSSDLAQMAAQIEGEVPGFRVDTFLGNNNIQQLMQRHMHKVIGPKPDILSFAQAIDAELAGKIREDLKSYHRYDRQNTQRLDASIALYYLLPPEYAGEHPGWILHSNAQHGSQSRYVGYQHYLEDSE